MAHISGYDAYMDRLLDRHLAEDEGEPPYCSRCGTGLGGGYLAYAVNDELLCENCMDEHISEYKEEHEVLT